MRRLLLKFATAGSIVLAVSFVGHAQVVLKQPAPKYPKAANRTGVWGNMDVAVAIDEKGRVTTATVLNGPGWTCPTVTNAAINASREAARQAALRATFKPEGRPMTAGLQYPFGKPPDPNRKLIPVRLNGTPEIIGTQTANPNSSGPGVLNDKALELGKPTYPRTARAVRADGPVHVQILVDEDGTVLSAESLDGHPLLRNPARLAACGSRFSPTLYLGKPVKVSGMITYNFVP